MRSLPDDVVLNNAPDDFTIAVSDDGKVLSASVLIEGKKYELGLRPVRMQVALEQARDDIRRGIWQLMELGRIGRSDLMQFAAADRLFGRRSPLVR